MATIRRLAGLAGALTLSGALVAPPATAQQDRPETYIGSAAGRALDLTVLSLPKVTLGVSAAKVTSLVSAAAEGAGSLGLAGTTQKVEIASEGNSTLPESCAVPLPVAGILDVGLACGSASASIVAGNPVGTAEGSVAGIDVNGQTLLDSVGPIGETLTDTVATALDPVCSLIDLTCTVTDTVGDVLASVLETKTLEVSAGRSTSTVTAEGAKVTSTASSTGAEIKLLPLPVVGGTASTEPLATITVGAAKATAVYDRSTGTSTPTVDPSLVTVKLNTLLTNTLGIADEISVPVGQSIIVPGTEGTPLETEIVVAAGRTVTNPDGTVGAIADAVKVHALKGVSGGILLALASAEAGVGGTVAVSAPVPVIELPRTGGTPWLPAAGAGVLGLVVLVRRVVAR